MLFLDSDEYLTEELKDEIQNILPLTDCNGFYCVEDFILWEMDKTWWILSYNVITSF
ncbi:MAG: hypothetical protein IPL23_07065 [Saprospiraceae bacterium]|nr:hypothetical protein [Saprospiraceae bacterium]